MGPEAGPRPGPSSSQGCRPAEWSQEGRGPGQDHDWPGKIWNWREGVVGRATGMRDPVLCLFPNQGKTVVQAEIDAAAELIDFFRFNAKHAVELQQQQPLDAQGSSNTMLYRGLEVTLPHSHPLHNLSAKELTQTLQETSIAAPLISRCAMYHLIANFVTK